jgi:Tfp pilus assembly protein PilO
MKSPDIKEYLRQLSSLKDNPKAVIAIAAVVILLDLSLVLRGQWVSVGSMFKQARQLKSDIRNANDDARFFATYKTKVADLKKDLEGLNKMVVAEEDLPNAMESISKFADISVVRILKIRPIADMAAMKNSVKGAENFFRQKVTISAKCGFHQLGRFMALLEDAPVFFDIKSIEIQIDQQEYMKHLVTIVLEVVLKKA